MKFVIFDIGNVLAVDLYVVFLDVICNHVYKNALDADKHNAIKHAAALAMNEFKLGKISEDEYFDTVIRTSPLERDVIKTQFTNISFAIQFFKQQIRHSIQLYHDVIHLAKQVKDRGYGIGILSNHVHEWLAEIWRFEEGTIAKVFNDNRAVVVSCDPTVMAYKPNREVFEILIQKLRVMDHTISEADVLFIDDKQRNVEAARALGMHAIQFNAQTQSVEKLRGCLASMNILDNATSL